MKKGLQMITIADEKIVDNIKKFIEKIELERSNGQDIDWEKINWISTLDKMVDNLKIAPYSYRRATKSDVKNHFYTANCPKCGWFGASKFLLGGGAIADTGDYDDVYCPVCGNWEIEEL